MSSLLPWLDLFGVHAREVNEALFNQGRQSDECRGDAPGPNASQSATGEALTAIGALKRICGAIIANPYDMKLRRINIGGDYVAKNIVPAVRLVRVAEKIESATLGNGCGEQKVLNHSSLKPLGSAPKLSGTKTSRSDAGEGATDVDMQTDNSDTVTRNAPPNKKRPEMHIFTDPRLMVIQAELCKRGFCPIEPLVYQRVEVENKTNINTTALSQSRVIIASLELPTSADIAPIRHLMSALELAEDEIKAELKKRDLGELWQRVVANGHTAPNAFGGGEGRGDTLIRLGVAALRPCVKQCVALCLASLGILTNELRRGDDEESDNLMNPPMSDNFDSGSAVMSPSFSALSNSAYQHSLVTVSSCFDQESLWKRLKQMLLAKDLFTSTGSGVRDGAMNNKKFGSAASAIAQTNFDFTLEHVRDFVAQCLLEAASCFVYQRHSQAQGINATPQQLETIIQTLLRRALHDNLISTVDDTLGRIVDEVSARNKKRAIAAAKRTAEREHRSEYLFGTKLGGTAADNDDNDEDGNDNPAATGTSSLSPNGRSHLNKHAYTRVDPERLFTAVNIISDISALMERCAMITNSFVRYHRTASLALLEQFKESGGRDFAFLYKVKEEWEAKYEALRKDFGGGGQVATDNAKIEAPRTVAPKSFLKPSINARDDDDDNVRF